MVVDLAVEDDLNRLVLVGERLRPAGQVDDAQAPVPEGGPVVDEDAGPVGAAMREHVAHPQHAAAVVRPQRVSGDDSRDSTHESQSPLGRAVRTARPCGRWCSGVRRRARAAWPSAAACAGSSIRATTASASAAGSSGGTRRPLTPSRTTSGMPPTRVATTGSAVAIASMRAFGKASDRDGSTNRSWSRRTGATSRDSPTKRRRLLTPSARASARAARASGRRRRT